MSALAERLLRLRTEAGARLENPAALADAGLRTELPALRGPCAEAGVRPEVMPLESATVTDAASSTQRAAAPASDGLKLLLRRHVRARDAAATSAEQSARTADSEVAVSNVAVGGAAKAEGQPAPQVECRAGETTGIEIAPGLFECIERLPLSAPPPWQWLPDVAPQLLPTDALLHFDTETTGLAGGAGTRAFMLGYSRWSSAGLELRQLWITRLGAEASMLERFAQWLSAAPVQLVSYNGRSFDAPLLAARYRLSRQRNPLTDLPHHDLLPAVRRRFKAHWPSCRMAEVEARLLGIERHDDLPGAQAPAAFLQALRYGRMQALQRVVLHHRQDLISLALLLPRLAQDSSQAPRDWALARVELQR